MLSQPSQEGQGLADHALTLVLVAVVILAPLGSSIRNSFSDSIETLLPS